MSVVCFIPIKSRSERFPNKNFQPLNSRPLYQYIIEAATNAGCFNEIYVDSDSEIIREYVLKEGLKFIERDKDFLGNDINGNDLLFHHMKMYPDFDFYFQLFVTAPLLNRYIIKECFERLRDLEQYDSVFTALEEKGWFWYQGQPVNYRPSVLPRSQDAMPVIRETTGLYGIRKEALRKYKCRIGKNPYIFIVDKKQAIDIDTKEDLEYCEWLLKNGI